MPLLFSMPWTCIIVRRCHPYSILCKRHLCRGTQCWLWLATYNVGGGRWYLECGGLVCGKWRWPALDYGKSNVAPIQYGFSNYSQQTPHRSSMRSSFEKSSMSSKSKLYLSRYKALYKCCLLCYNGARLYLDIDVQIIYDCAWNQVAILLCQYGH